ncbi:hypothetical protein [Flavobacterium sp. N1994]|uniref:hypothetical protein n=1 Tax=Flavobacterium sp. N1994 TaxID=2986827 RepID=UPI002222A6EA|nr:hypothetical protein [Flavobacterium sp. N1994]
MKNSYFYILLLFFVACKSNPENQPQEEPQGFTPHSEAVVEETYHTDTTYKYEHRTGTSGDYQYNYDVSGTNQDGDEVTGNVTMQDKYGEGILNDDDGNEIEVKVEWDGYGKLKATDNDGNEYELEAD